MSNLGSLVDDSEDSDNKLLAGLGVISLSGRNEDLIVEDTDYQKFSVPALRTATIYTHCLQLYKTKRNEYSALT